MVAPDAERTAWRRWSTAGSSPSRAADGRGVDPERQGHGDGTGQIGGLHTDRALARPRPGRARRRTPTSVARRRPGPRTTSAPRSTAEQRHTRFPGASARSASARQPAGRRPGPRPSGPLEDLGLGLDDPILGPEPLEVHGPDGRDHGDVGRAPPAQVGDLPGAVGTHLGHEHLGAIGQVLVDGPGQSGPVVEAGRAWPPRSAGPGPGGRCGPWSTSSRRTR